MMSAALVATLLLGQGAAASSRPRAEVTALRPSASIAPGSSAVLTLKVHLPDGIHVQGDKPRDPSLIATTLVVTPPSGVSLDRVVFPAAQDFVQAGQQTALLVFASDFSVQAYIRVSPDQSPGALKIPVTLRYQACNDRVCFAPTRATAEWTIVVTA